MTLKMWPQDDKTVEGQMYVNIGISDDGERIAIIVVDYKQEIISSLLVVDLKRKYIHLPPGIRDDVDFKTDVVGHALAIREVDLEREIGILKYADKNIREHEKDCPDCNVEEGKKHKHH